jgi:hypothetical protein
MSEDIAVCYIAVYIGLYGMVMLTVIKGGVQSGCKSIC